MRGRRRGALLLEVLAGIGIFATALLFAFSVFPNSAKATAQSRNYTIARAIARDYLERELIKSYDAMAPGIFFEPVVFVSDGVETHKSFEVVVAVTELDQVSAGDPIDRLHVKVTVSWNLDSDSEREVSLESWATR